MPRAYPRVSQAIWLLVLVVVLTIAMFILALIVGGRWRGNTTGALTAVVNTLSIGAVVVWGYRKSSSALDEVFPVRPVRAAFVAPMFLMLLGAIALSTAASGLVEAVWPAPESFRWAAQKILRQGGWTASFCLLVVAPLTEEPLFRGVILHGFLRNYGRRLAIVASALLFALFHLNPWQFTSAFILGAVLGWFRAETGSLMPCFLGHAFANFVAMLWWTAWRVNLGHGTPETDALFLPLWAWGALGASLLGTGVWWFRRQSVRDARLRAQAE
jgi:membrane protease YdiL (CAAX protease family)